MKKLIFLIGSALILGGCTLSNLVPTGGQSTSASPVATPTPTPDSALESQPAVGSGTDDNSLESDINSPQILDEDFSDLE